MILDEEHGELDHEKNIPIQFGSMALLLLPPSPKTIQVQFAFISITDFQV